MNKKTILYILITTLVISVANFAFTPGKTKAAVLLGRVFLGGYQGCSRFYFGTGCGAGACIGGPDYKVTWYQGSSSSTIFSNSCEGGLPRYTFEKTSSPSGSKEGVLTDIEFELNYPINLTTWYLNATSSNGNTCAPVQLGSLIRNGNKYKVVGAKIYDFEFTRSGNKYQCNWNHFWMYTPEGTVYVTPTVVPSVVPSITPSVTPGITPSVTPTVIVPSPVVNTPPTCGANPLIKNPNKTYYLPGEKVNLVASNYTDANNDPVTVTNWFTNSGVLSNTAADKTTLTLPPTSNVVTTVSYVISDGKSNTTCSSTITTKLAYSCTNNSCTQNGEGSYTNYGDCLSNCTGSGLYSCNQNGQCVFDPAGGNYSSSNCNNECVVLQSTCEQINVSGNLNSVGSSVDLSALVRNFAPTATTYQWVSQKGSSIDISNDPNCNQTTKICTMDLNKSYTTAKVKYTVPSTNDTVYFKVNNSIVPICRLNVNTGTGSSKDILLNFRSNLYNINVGTNSDVILDIRPVDNFSNYLLNLTCTVNATGTPCPSGSYKFAQSSSTQLQTGSLTAGQTYSKNITLNFSSSTQVTLNVIGDTIPEDLSLRRFANTLVNIQNPNPLSYSVKFNNNFLPTKQSYCTQNVGSSYNDITINLGKLSETPVTYNLSLGQTLPSTIVDGTYSVSANLNTSGLPQEIKCVMVNGIISESNSTNFTVNNSNTNITYILGPVEGDAWYQAFGGSAYSFGGFSSPILNISAKIVQSVANVLSGVVLTNSVLNVPNVSNMPDKYAIFSGFPLALKNIDSIKNTLSNSNITKINNVSQINFGNDTNFYYFEGDLNLNSDIQKSPAQKIPVVFVTGNINISNQVKNIDLFLISDKTINIGNDSTALMDLTVRGGLLSRNSFNFNSLKKVNSVDGKLTESVYFDPSIYFSKSASSMFFKSVNVFANVID